MLKVEPTERFSSRVENYVRFRPSYPPQVIDVLREECGLKPDSVAADVACGTGIFTRLLLENGNRVFGIEPNSKMRAAAEEYSSAYPGFNSIAATAETTTLPDNSVDLITCAQAAHWFDRDKALAEFQRILKLGCFLALIWNDRRVQGTAFGEDYERLALKYGTDYTEVQRLGRLVEGNEFFSPFKCEKRVLPNFQDLDYEALEGRLLSSSYAPQPGEPEHAPMLAELGHIFQAHQQNGHVRMDYDTNIYFGKLS